MLLAEHGAQLREEEVVLFVNVLVQVELEAVEGLEQAAVRAAVRSVDSVAAGEFPQSGKRVARLRVLGGVLVDRSRESGGHSAAFGKRPRSRKKLPLLTLEVLEQVVCQRAEEPLQIVELRMLARVDADDRCKQLGDARQLVPQPVVMCRDDVIAQADERRATQVVRHDPAPRLVVDHPVEQDSDRFRIESASPARFGQRLTAPAAVVEAQLLESLGQPRPLRCQQAEGLLGVDRSSHDCFSSCITEETRKEKTAEMTYVIGEPCIDIKDRSCVDVCPVDCIHEVGRMFVIDPEECIECGACEPECPVEAIFPEDALPEKWHEFVAINAALVEGSETVDRYVDAYIATHELPAIEGQR